MLREVKHILTRKKKLVVVAVGEIPVYLLTQHYIGSYISDDDLERSVLVFTASTFLLTS